MWGLELLQTCECDCSGFLHCCRPEYSHEDCHSGEVASTSELLVFKLLATSQTNALQLIASFLRREHSPYGVNLQVAWSGAWHRGSIFPPRRSII